MSMRISKQFSAVRLVFAAVLLLTALSSFAQTRTEWRTADDIAQGMGGVLTGTLADLEDMRRFDLRIDGDESAIRIVTDSVATRYVGFGEGVDPGATFQGSSGFAKLRVGDRLRVRGVGAGGPTVNADEIVLLGRDVRVQERPSSAAANVEGVVRSVSPRDSRVVIETDRRGIETVVGTDTTPVHYRGKTYRIRNLEPGDRIRVEVASKSRGTITATSIEVVEDIREDGDSPRRRTVTSISGQITRVDPRLATFRVNTGRDEILVDAKAAVDREGRRLRMDQIRIGDRVEVSGEFDSMDTFRADTVRFVGRDDLDRDDRDDALGDDDEEESDDEEDAYVAVLVEGTVYRPLDASGVLVVRDAAGRSHRVLVEDDFIVRTRTGHTTADKLEKGGKVAVKAYRDDDRNLIAQTIRLR